MKLNISAHRSWPVPVVFYCLILDAFFSLSVDAADLSASPAYQVIYQNCPKLTAGLMSQPDFVSIFQHRAINIDNVCACSANAALSDTRLKRLAKLSKTDFDGSFQDVTFRSYFVVRMTQSILGCFSTELDVVLKGVDLEHHD